MGNNIGIVKKGYIAGYDPNTMTALIRGADGGMITDVVCGFDRYDPDNGAYGITPPSANSPCLYVQSGGETFILMSYPPMNVNPDSGGDNPDIFGASQHRTPSDMRNSGSLSGEASTTTSMGGEETFTNMMKKIILSPGKLSSTWNMLNCIWENFCSVFRLYSGGLDIVSETTEGGTCNTTFNVRCKSEERTGTPMVNLAIGDTAGVINLKIDGENILYIDANRNVILTTKNIYVTAEDIVVTANTLDCTAVGAVKLP